MKVLLDTNVYTAFKRGDPTALARVRSAQQVVFSAIVAGELLFGFRHGARFDLQTGIPMTLPAFESVPVYPVSVRGDGIVVVDVPD